MLPFRQYRGWNHKSRELPGQGLRYGYAGAFTPPCPADVPLDVIAAFGQSIPVVSCLWGYGEWKAFSIARRI